jgi:hypothetical protein
MTPSSVRKDLSLWESIAAIASFKASKNGIGEDLAVKSSVQIKPVLTLTQRRELKFRQVGTYGFSVPRPWLLYTLLQTGDIVPAHFRPKERGTRFCFKVSYLLFSNQQFNPQSNEPLGGAQR